MREVVMNDVHKKVLDYIGTRLSVDPEITVSIEDDLLKQEILTSITMLPLVLFLEQEFHVRVRDNDLLVANFRSVSAIADFVQRKLVPAEA
jgi:methoxymalonate biosynthesis acyl carrier protein